MHSKPIALFNVNHILSKVLRVTIIVYRRQAVQTEHNAHCVDFHFSSNTIDFHFLYPWYVFFYLEFSFSRRHRTKFPFKFKRFLLQSVPDI